MFTRFYNSLIVLIKIWQQHLDFKVQVSKYLSLCNQLDINVFVLFYYEVNVFDLKYVTHLKRHY